MILIGSLFFSTSHGQNIEEHAQSLNVNPDSQVIKKDIVINYDLINSVQDYNKKENFINLNEVLKLLSAGYCGLGNYNIWLTAVDNEVKLSRVDFEELYLKKFEEIIGKKATPRGYRRVRYP